MLQFTILNKQQLDLILMQLIGHYAIAMVEESDLMLSFSDIDSTASLDSLFVHKDFQRKGIAKKSGGT